MFPAGMESSEDEEDFMVHNYTENEKPTNSSNSFISEVRGEDLGPSNSSFTNEHRPSPYPEKLPLERKYLHLPSGEALDDLRVAVLHDKLELVKQYLEQGIAVDCILKAGWTGLMYACSRGHHEVVRHLLEKNADPNFHKDKFTPMMAVCASSQESETDLHLCVQHLLEFGAEVNVWERHLTTPLMFAAREGRAAIIQELIRVEADLNRQDNRGYTALTWAASRGFGQIVRILLNAQADPTKLSTSGQTAADVAYSCHHETIGEILEKVSLSVDKALASEDQQKLQLWHKPVDNGYMAENKHYVQYGELELFLCGMNVPDLIPLFHQHRITFQDVLVMTEEDLEKIGVTQFGVRKRILDSILDVHKKKWEKSSLPNLRKKFISCPDAVSLMANIAHHLRYIEKSVAYLRCQLQHHPRILELGQEAASVHKLLKETEESRKNCSVLQDEIRFFKKHLEKVQDNVEYIPADLIVEKALNATEKSLLQRRASVALVIFGTAAALGFVLWKRPTAISGLLTLPQSWHAIAV